MHGISMNPSCALDIFYEVDNKCEKAAENFEVSKEDGLKILIVEDEEISRMVIEKFA